MSPWQPTFPTPAVSLTEHPATLPEAEIPDSVDHASVASTSLARLNDLSVRDLTENAIWRDSLALTGTLRTFFGPKLITRVWDELGHKHRPANFTFRTNSSHIMRLGPKTCWIEANFDFEVGGEWPARCSGIIGLVPTADVTVDGDGKWSIWLLSTILERPDSWPDVDDLRPLSPELSEGRACASMNGTSADSNANFPEHVDCLVVGAGISGLCMAGRLQALGVSYLLVEKHANVGDIWLNERYDSLKLHTSREYNQLPGLPRTFRPEDPYNLGTLDIASGFRRYVDTFGINIRTSTTLVSAKWAGETKNWTFSLDRHGASISMTARHIVLAVGSMGVHPILPSLPNRDLFQGDVLHGMEWKNGSPWKGKSGIVVGSANTAQGIIADMASASFKAITMTQRSRTFLLPTSTFSGLVDPVYNLQTSMEASDRMLLGYPLPIQRLMAMAGIRMLADQRPEYFDRILGQGFDGERYGDLWGMMYDREGGHFFDLGAGELIANGTVKVRSKVEPVAFTSTGLELSDGSQVDADVVVFATGYSGNIRDSAKKIFGDEIGESLEEFWQCDEEGESRGAWKYIGHPGLWYTGHGYAHARYYSRFVAMHIKADIEGKGIEMYAETPHV